MNTGNRLRAAVRKGRVTLAAIKAGLETSLDAG